MLTNILKKYFTYKTKSCWKNDSVLHILQISLKSGFMEGSKRLYLLLCWHHTLCTMVSGRLLRARQEWGRKDVLLLSWRHCFLTDLLQIIYGVPRPQNCSSGRASSRVTGRLAVHCPQANKPHTMRILNDITGCQLFSKPTYISIFYRVRRF